MATSTNSCHNYVFVLNEAYWSYLQGGILLIMREKIAQILCGVSNVMQFYRHERDNTKYSRGVAL